MLDSLETTVSITSSCRGLSQASGLFHEIGAAVDCSTSNACMFCRGVGASKSIMGASLSAAAGWETDVFETRFSTDGPFESHIIHVYNRKVLDPNEAL